MPLAVAEYQSVQDLELASFPAAEAQVVAIADDIAYDTHDIDDGLRAGLFEVGGPQGGAAARRHPRRDRARLSRPGAQPAVHELERRLITRLVRDVVAESGRRLAEIAPASVEAVRAAGRPVIGFSARHVRAASGRSRRSCFRACTATPGSSRRWRRRAARCASCSAISPPIRGDMPEEWRRGLEGAEEGRLKRRVADYIAGMTDRFPLLGRARADLSSLNSTPDLR